MFLQIAEAHSSVFKVCTPPTHIRNPDKTYVFERLIPAFGTKRSQVQILSPRPAKRPISCEIRSFFIAFYTSESLPPGAILIRLVQNRRRYLPVSGRLRRRMGRDRIRF